MYGWKQWHMRKPVAGKSFHSNFFLFLTNYLAQKASIFQWCTLGCVLIGKSFLPYWMGERNIMKSLWTSRTTLCSFQSKSSLTFSPSGSCISLCLILWLGSNGFVLEFSLRILSTIWMVWRASCREQNTAVDYRSVIGLRGVPDQSIQSDTITLRTHQSKQIVESSNQFINNETQN